MVYGGAIIWYIWYLWVSVGAALNYNIKCVSLSWPHACCKSSCMLGCLDLVMVIHRGVVGLPFHACRCGGKLPIMIHLIFINWVVINQRRCRNETLLHDANLLVVVRKIVHPRRVREYLWVLMLVSLLQQKIMLSCRIYVGFAWNSMSIHDPTQQASVLRNTTLHSIT